MAHFGTAVIIDRVVALLRQELPAELALVDAAANARAAEVGDEFVFSTTGLATADIEGFTFSRHDANLSVVVFEDSRPREYPSEMKQEAIEGSPSNRPRLLTRHHLVVRVRAKSTSGAWTKTGAFRRCDRLSTACVVVLNRFTRLSAPAPLSLAPLVHFLEVPRDGLTKPTEEQDALLWDREIDLHVQTLEDR